MPAVVAIAPTKSPAVSAWGDAAQRIICPFRFHLSVCAHITQKETKNHKSGQQQQQQRKQEKWKPKTKPKLAREVNVLVMNSCWAFVSVVVVVVGSLVLWLLLSLLRRDRCSLNEHRIEYCTLRTWTDMSPPYGGVQATAAAAAAAAGARVN